MNKSKAQELQAASDRFDSKLADQVAATIEAEERSQDLEKKLGLANIKVQETYQSLDASEEQCQDLERRLAATEREKQKVGLILLTPKRPALNDFCKRIGRRAPEADGQREEGDSDRAGRSVDGIRRLGREGDKVQGW